MQLNFTYDLKKDTENFLKSFSSINNKKPTKLQELYTKQIGEVDVERIPTFLQKQKIDISAKLKEIENEWKGIEQEVFARMKQLFGTQLSRNITVYLSTNSRCTYSIPEDYFFVYMNSKHPNGVIMHELLHFYTWHAFHEDLELKGVSKEKYNDIKESLTELLNTDFQDLLNGYYDKGYPQHQEIRKEISRLRKDQNGIKEIIEKIIS